MKKKPQSKVSRLPPRTAHEAEREELRRRNAAAVRRERKIRQLTRQLTRELAAADHDLKVLAVKVLFPEGVASQDAGEVNLITGK